MGYSRNEDWFFIQCLIIVKPLTLAANPFSFPPMRKVLHVDCDCFFAAVEMRDEPRLRELPIAIGGASDRRGVIATCNYPARRFGVRSAMATAHALRLCPDLVLLPGNMEKYRAASRQVMDILRPYGLAFQQVSVDEAYLELPLASNPTEVARQIQQQVAAEVGITVSVGVAPNKFLAKVASDWRKPAGLFVVRPDEVASFVAKLPVGKIPGVGPKSVERLQRYGIETCADVQQHEYSFLLDRFGQFGDVLFRRSRGQDDRAVEERYERKSMSVERTFAEDLADPVLVDEVLLNLWQRLSKRVQQNDVQWDTLAPFVKIKFADFQVTSLSDHHRSVTFENYRLLVRRAMAREQKAVRLIGIGARLPQPAGGQLSLDYGDASA